MIKKLFLPEILNNKRVYAQTILGVYIQKNRITCAKIYAARSKNIIQKTLEQYIEDGPEDTYNQRAATALKKIISQSGKYDQIKISISSSLVVFKELEVPFIDPEKIRMILDYEVEPLLPFSTDEAVLDFVITNQDKTVKKSQILVAAIRTQDLANVLDIYSIANIEPNTITIDLFAIYSLYQQIPEYKNIKKACALVALGSYTTRVAFIQNGELKLTRTIPRGLLTVAKNVSDETQIPVEKVKEQLSSFGLQTIANQDLYEKSLQKHIINFFNDIQFTLNSFSLKITQYQGISKILFTGSFANLKGLSHFCTNLLQIPSEVFDFEKIFTDRHFKNKISSSHQPWITHITALGTALPSKQQLNFNLRRKEFANLYSDVTKKQLNVALTIIIALFASLSIHGFMQIHSLSNKIKKVTQREISKIKRILPNDIRLGKKETLKTISKKAENLLNEKAGFWQAFEKTGLRPLEIIQELTNILDKRRFNISLESVSITQENKIPKVEVEGYFKSKTGSDNFKYFEELEARFKNSKQLQLWNEKEGIDTDLGGDKGIKFIATLKPKEL